jgi:methanogenic corrinoid protein MtbC1
MGEVGRRYECEEHFVPDLLLSGRAMKSALDIVALSALLTVAMPVMKTSIEAPCSAGVRERVKLIAREIGGDGYSENAGPAVGLARSLVAARRNPGPPSC